MRFGIVLCLFVALSGYSQSQLKELVLKNTKALGLPEKQVSYYFSGKSPGGFECFTADSTETKFLSKLVLTYPGLAYLYCNKDTAYGINEFIMIIHRTPFNSFRARLGRNDFNSVKGNYSPQHVLTWVKGNMKVEAYFYKPLVMDIISYMAECLDKKTEELEDKFTVVIFSVIKSK